MRVGLVALCGLFGTSCLTEVRYECPPGGETTASVRCGQACATGELGADTCALVRVACNEGRLSERDCAGLDGDQGMPDQGMTDPDLGGPDLGPLDLGVDLGPCGGCPSGTVCQPVSGMCVQCFNASHCDGALGQCGAANTCVECTDNSHCDTGTPFCQNEACVACRSNADCPDANPVCSTTTHTCGPCASRFDCLNRTGAPSCDTTSGACVLCDIPNESADCAPGLRCFNRTSCTPCRPATATVDCTAPNASACNSVGECAPCANGSNQCSHVSDDRNRCDGGLCVECTTVSESIDCGSNSCNPATRSCTTTPRFSRSVCQPCVADTECIQVGGAPHRCVPMNYQGTNLGGFCLRAASMPGPTGCARPFLTPIFASSLSGVASAGYCGIDQSVTSCAAVRALLDGQSCPTGQATECMAEGALCETVGFADDQCTYPCGTASDCPTVGSSSTCGAGHCGS